MREYRGVNGRSWEIGNNETGKLVSIVLDNKETLECLLGCIPRNQGCNALPGGAGAFTNALLQQAEVSMTFELRCEAEVR